MATNSWLDRTLLSLAPEWHLRRVRARLAAELVQRHYEAAAAGRRTQGWSRTAGDANAVLGGKTLATLREIARDLVRNNPHAESALGTIIDHTIGWGITARPVPDSPRFAALWKEWAETTACDADGRHDFYGLQKLALSTAAESGEAIVRRRSRRLEDGLPLPLQVQILEPDFIDSSKNGALPNGGQIVQGVEFDPIGTRVAYWLFPTHPGSSVSTGGSGGWQSRRVPASEVLHVFRTKRAGQVRAATWFAPTIVRMKEFDEYEDATLVKAKIAACLAVITSDTDGTGAPLGTTTDAQPEVDMLSPGAILNIAPGRSVDIVSPPSTSDHASYASVTLRAIAAGLGVAYEDLTGDYTNLPFSAARMSRLKHWARVEDWRWQLMIPQFCDPVWKWAVEAGQIMGLGEAPKARWSPPPMPMLEPDREGLAVQRNIRTGIQSLSAAIRERGLDPDELLGEIAADNAKLDALGIVLDSDARKMTQNGQGQPTAAKEEA